MGLNIVLKEEDLNSETLRKLLSKGELPRLDVPPSKVMHQLSTEHQAIFGELKALRQSTTERNKAARYEEIIERGIKSGALTALSKAIGAVPVDYAIIAKEIVENHRVVAEDGTVLYVIDSDRD